MIKRRTELIILLTILLFAILIVLLPIFYHQPYQANTNPDYWSHSTRMRQFEVEGYMNFEVDWTNAFRIEGESKYYPFGFPMLLNSLREVGSLGYSTPALISLLFSPFFCLLLYLISRKLLGSAGIALLTAFLGACFISGTNMLGPVFPLASTLAVLMMISAFLILLIIPDHSIKILLGALFFGTIFISHRASIGAWLLMMPFIAILPLLFTKNRRHFLEHVHYPLISSTLIGLAISMIFWLNLPIEDIMKLGGILPTGIDEMLGLEFSKLAFMAIIYIGIVLVISIYVIPFIGRHFPREFEPVFKMKISTIKFIITALIFPFFLIAILLWFIISNDLSLPTSPKGFVYLWNDISSLANVDNTARIFKQMLYSWHWNLVPLSLLIPSAYIYLKSNRRNLFLSISLAALFTLVLIFIVQDLLFDIKVQRMYFYLSPFVFFLSAWGGHTLLKDKKFNKQLKRLIIILMIGSVILVAYSSIYIVTPMPSGKIEGITWTEESISSDDIISSTGYATQEARGLGQNNYVILVGLLQIQNHYQLINYLKVYDAKYIFIPPEMSQLNKKVTQTESVFLIYSTEDTNIYLIGVG